MIYKPMVIYPGDMKFISTGIAISIGDSSVMGMIVPRSGLGTQGLVLGNSTGIIDSNYRGEIKLTPLNRIPRTYRLSSRNTNRISNVLKHGIIINPGDRIAQLIFAPIIQATFNVVDELDETIRGDKGFGSSGKNKVKHEK